MCFRPPSAGKPIKCPQCGAMNPPTKKECMKCQADLTANPAGDGKQSPQNEQK